MAVARRKRFIGPVGANRSDAAWRQVYRSLQHGEAKARCESLPDAFSQDLKDVADAFLTLQRLRHDADYDPFATFERPDVQNYILSAEDSIRKLVKADLKDRKAFIVWLLFANRKKG